MKLTKQATRTAVMAAVTGSAVVLAGGVAYAYWTANGSGAGSATASTASTVSVTTGTIASGLYPGASGVAGSVTISNSNPFPVKVTSASVGSIVVDSSHSGCTTTGVAITPQSLTTPVSVAAKSGSTNGTAPLSFTAAMDNTSLDACQGATFTITLNVTVTS